jgi:hypothetical protein
VEGAEPCAWALSTDSDTPLCSDQLKENIPAHTNAEAAMATFLVCFIGFLRYTGDNMLPGMLTGVSSPRLTAEWSNVRQMLSSSSVAPIP